MMVSAGRSDGTDEREVAVRQRQSLFTRLATSSSQFANKHGVYLGRRSTKLHVAAYRRSNGRFGGHLPGWPSARILLLDHIGAKSGIRRTSPLMYHDEGEFVVVVASKGGQPNSPAWFHNLKAHPDTTIQIGSQVRRVRARAATGAERDSLWLKCLAFYPGYEFFQRNARGRRIPIVILAPRE